MNHRFQILVLHPAKRYCFNTTNGNKNNNNTTTNNNNNNGAPLLPPTTRSRQMSLGQSQDFTMEDLENFLNKESMSNILIG